MPDLELSPLNLIRRSLLISAAGIAASASAQQLPPPSTVDTGETKGNKVEFPNWTASTERPTPGPPNPTPPGRRVGYAVAGLGRLALENILPAFGQCKHSRLVSLVSGSPEKAKTVAAQYGIPPERVYGYDRFEAIASNPEIQAVYIVLPNGLHQEYVVRAARAGKHVLCEKPMANSSEQARAMVAACKEANRLLMIAYRSQYEPHNRQLLRMLRDQRFGPLQLLLAANTQNMADPAQWRLKKELAGGGSLPDVGLYCLNAARFLSGEEPIEVMGRTYSPPDDPRFSQVEDVASFTLRFPSGFIAQCTSSYGLHEARYLHAHTPAAAFDFQNAFAYSGHQLRVAHRDGKVESVDELRVESKDQFALELDHFSECIRANRQPHTPGEEGLQDQLVMEAIYRSAAIGQPVRLPPVSGRDTTRGPAPEES